jgi:hypothetical protein
LRYDRHDGHASGEGEGKDHSDKYHFHWIIPQLRYRSDIVLNIRMLFLRENTYHPACSFHVRAPFRYALVSRGHQHCFSPLERAKMERSFVRSAAVEKRELSKTDFEMIDDAFKALLQSSHPNPLVEAKIVDLREKFRDAFTGWLEIEEAA